MNSPAGLCGCVCVQACVCMCVGRKKDRKGKRGKMSGLFVAPSPGCGSPEEEVLGGKTSINYSEDGLWIHKHSSGLKMSKPHGM